MTTAMWVAILIASVGGGAVVIYFAWQDLAQKPRGKDSSER